MTSPREPVPINQHELGPYIATFVLAGELKEALALQPSVASNEFFGISDPRTLDLIDIPIEISTEKVRGLVLNLSSHTEPDTHIVHRSASLLLEFDDSTANISYGSDEPHESLEVAIVDDADPNNIRSGYIPAKEVSDIVSRALRPYNDPMFSDYTQLTTPENMNDVSMTLSENEFASHISIKHYVHDNHQIDITLENDQLRELSIDQPFGLDDADALVLRITQDTAEYSLQIFHRELVGSKEIPASEDEIKAFRDILIDITESLGASNSAPTAAIDVNDVNLGLL